MKAKKPRTSRIGKAACNVVISSFEPGCLIEFTDPPGGLPIDSTTQNKGSANGKASAKKLPSVSDRRYLRDIEIWLNNCVNFAQRLEAKQGAKILQLVTQAREQAIKLRG